MMRCDPGKLCIARIFQNTCSPSIHSEGMSDMESCYPILRHVNSFGLTATSSDLFYYDPAETSQTTSTVPRSNHSSASTLLVATSPSST